MAARERGRPRGRPARPGLERLVKLLALLAAASDSGDGEQAVSRDRLLAAVGDYPEDIESASQTLQRDVLWLNEFGWRIESVGEAGSQVQYRLVPGDPRLRLLLNRDELSALRWALAAVGTTWLDELLARDAPPLTRRPPTFRVPSATAPDALDDVLTAVRHRAVLTVADGEGRSRRLEPLEVSDQFGDWLLVARDLADDRLDLLVVRDLQHVETGSPGSVQAGSRAGERLSADPCLWPVDPEMTARVGVRPGQAHVVARYLGGHLVSVDDDLLCVRITHRAAFLARLSVVGRAARLLEPPDLVAEAVARLDATLSGLSTCVDARPVAAPGEAGRG